MYPQLSGGEAIVQKEEGPKRREKGQFDWHWILWKTRKNKENVVIKNGQASALEERSPHF